jgi:6-phosphogluconolactonase
MKCFAATLFLSIVISMSQPLFAQEQRLFVGTATNEGIFSCALDVKNGKLSATTLVAKAPQPGFLALHPSLPVLYSVTAERTKPNGGVRSYVIDQAQRTLVDLNQQLSGDDGATHLQIDQRGRVAIVAHYSGGSTAALPVAEDGKLQSRAGFIRHQGSSVDQRRQQKPHAHGVAISHDGRFVCVADLGTDRVDVFRIGNDATLTKTTAWQAQPGAGPRHLAFHPSGKFLYCIQELDSTISVLQFDSGDGSLQELQTITTLPPDFEQDNLTAEVVVHPSGKFLYGSNRGHNSTAVFAIEPHAGTLQLVEIEPTQGDHPRFIGLDPTGQYLVAANRDSNCLVSFAIDQQTGALTPTGHQTTVPQPICIVFVQE